MVRFDSKLLNVLALQGGCIYISWFAFDRCIQYNILNYERTDYTLVHSYATPSIVTEMYSKSDSAEKERSLYRTDWREN